MNNFTELKGQGMDLSPNTIERMCRIYGHLSAQEKAGIEFVSSLDLAKAIGTTGYTVRKDISSLAVTGYTRKGYSVKPFKKALGRKLGLDKERKACIVGLGRLGSALMDYERFQQAGFDIVAGFDSSVNKLERIKTSMEVFPDTQIKDVVARKGIELGIIAVPAGSAQSIADRLVDAGVKGILNFSPVKINVPDNVVHADMDFTNALRFIAARFSDK